MTFKRWVGHSVSDLVRLAEDVLGNKESFDQCIARIGQPRENIGARRFF